MIFFCLDIQVEFEVQILHIVMAHMKAYVRKIISYFYLYACITNCYQTIKIV
jgi:hypothetical protein